MFWTIFTRYRKNISDIYNKISNGDNSEKLLDLLGKYQTEFENWDGYSAKSELENMIIQMGVNNDSLNKKTC